MARTFICRGRPVFLARRASILLATPELSMTAVQKAMASSEGNELKAGTGRVGSRRAEPFPQLGLGPGRPRDVAGVTQQ